MDKMLSTKKFVSASALISLTVIISAQEVKTSATDYLNTLLIPAIVAVVGYILKTLYEALVERSKRRRTLLEEKLKNFYWPILTRLEENNAIWRLILSKHDKNDLEKAIGLYVESNIILKNHREIMSIIIQYRYYAKFDAEFNIELNKYFMHVAIYEGILKSNEDTLPGLIGAPYPVRFDDIIQNRTESLQRQLDRKIIW